MVSNPANTEDKVTTHRSRALAERVYAVLQHTSRLPVDVHQKIQAVAPRVTPYASHLVVTICTQSSAPTVTLGCQGLNAARLVLKACICKTS